MPPPITTTSRVFVTPRLCQTPRVIETLKQYLGLGPGEDYATLGRRARRINIGLFVLVVLVMLFVGNIWLRLVLFVAAFVLSVVVSLVSRDVERAQRPQ